MSAQPASSSSLPSIDISTSTTSSPSLWNRITDWASERKAVVYTVAGAAVVVTGAGLVYYYRDSRPQSSSEHRPSKKERRKAKREKEAAEKRASGESGLSTSSSMNLTDHAEEETSSASKRAKVEEAPVKEIPQVDEVTIATLSEQVRFRSAFETLWKLTMAGTKGSCREAKSCR